MTVCGQVCLRDFQNFKIENAEFSIVPQGVVADSPIAECITFNDGIPYPDILSSKRNIAVKAHYTQTLWVTFSITINAVSGNYPITFSVHTDVGDFTAEFTLNVYSVALPDPKNASFGHEYFFQNGSKNSIYHYNPYKIERYSDEWWHLMQNYAKTMKELRINSFYLTSLVFLQDAGSKKIGESEWFFNFEILDKFVKTFLKFGSFNRITLSAIVSSADGTTIQSIDENGHLTVRLTDGTRAELASGEISLRLTK